jgi:hypothetical protein
LVYRRSSGNSMSLLRRAAREADGTFAAGT